MDDSNLLTPIKTRRPRRSFSTEEKKQILDDAYKTSFAEAARRNQISASLLFQWRKNFNRSFSVLPIDHDQITDHERVLEVVHRLEMLEALISEKLMAEIKSDRMSAYNAATAFGSLTNAVAKLVQMEQDIAQRIQQPAIGEPVNSSLNLTLVEERRAEEWCLELIRKSLAEKPATVEAATLSLSPPDQTEI